MIEGAILLIWLVAYTAIVFGALVGLLIFAVVRKKS